MKIFALRDDTIVGKDLAYIIYSEREKNCYIEIPDEITDWELPFILEHFVRNGKRTVGSYWSREFIRNRIVPPDRQNLGMILRDNKLSEYDEFKLFILADGRCAQDDCYIVPIKSDNIPDMVIKRKNTHIESAVACGKEMLITLKNGDVYSTQLQDRLLAYVKRVGFVKDCMGCGLIYDESELVRSEDLVKNGIKLPITSEMLKAYATKELISTSDAIKLLGCSRQNLDNFVKRGKITPAPINATCRMFFRSDIENITKTLH